jgi:hypothetical protein
MERQLIHLLVSDQMYREVRRLAHRRNQPISSVVRDALAAHLARELGVEVSPVMQRGGWRERKGG